MKLDKLLIIILVLAFLVRIFPLGFPSLTSDEARIAFRGYSLATSGKDELGRSLPLFFNSLEDYQLPLVSYITTVGIFLFGKTDFGARILFILIGTALVLLTYKVANFFSSSRFFTLSSAFMVATCPALIFLSKIPNETIVLTFIFTLLFYLTTRGSNLVIALAVMLAAVFTSKLAFFILLPFTIFTLIFSQKNLIYKKKWIFIILSGLVLMFGLGLFFTNEQAKRSLVENNFPLFSDITIKNGIDKLRGQGLESGWPKFIDIFLFNKSHFLSIGLLHWLSYFNPAIYFGQLDASGKISYSFLGAWTKVLIIPFTLGIFLLIRLNAQKILLLGYFLILTFPAIFIYPHQNLELIVLTLPFMAVVSAFGLLSLNRKVVYLIFFLVITELTINIYNLNSEYKNTTDLRPNWVKELALDIYKDAKNQEVLVSDDVVLDINPFIEWYAPVNPREGFYSVASPYKFRQYSLGNVKLLGSEQKFTTCGIDQKMIIFASKRDLKKISIDAKPKIQAMYNDSNGQSRVYLLENSCIK